MNTDSYLLETVLINDSPAVFYRAAKEGLSSVVMWFSDDGDIVFMLDAALPDDELIMIAESVELCQ